MSTVPCLHQGITPTIQKILPEIDQHRVKLCIVSGKEKEIPCRYPKIIVFSRHTVACDD